VTLDETAEPEDLVAGVSGRKVLVADDNPANRILLRTILQAFGAEVSEACDGGEAVDLAGKSDFDLILMDLRMPGLDGARPPAASAAAGAHITPILAFSADREPVLDAALFRGSVPKPMTAAGLIEALNAAIGAAPARALEPLA
jgi:CheY-like chemotaxis protein